MGNELGSVRYVQRLARSLHSVGRVYEAATESELSQVYQVIVREAANLVGSSQCSLGLVQEESNDTAVVASLALSPPPQPARFPPGFGVAGWTASTGEAVVIPDTSKDPRYAPIRYPNTASFLAVPVKYHQRTVGVISCSKREVGAFDDVDLAVLSDFAEHAAIALMITRQLHSAAKRESEISNSILDIVHELKTPIGSLTGFVDILLAGTAGGITDTQHDFLTTARQECHRLLATVNALLTVSAARQQAQPRMETVDLGVLVDSVLQRLAPMGAQRQVTFEMNMPEGVPSLRADPQLLEHVLSNLLVNALEFSPSGERIKVACRLLERAVEVAVEDQGPGFPPEDLDKVFERFYRSGASRGRGYGEAGVGLAIARAIVEKHSGRIWAANKPGGGAVVTFTLPLELELASW